MGKRIDNVKAVFSDGSTRIRVIGTVVILVVGVVIGFFSFKGRSNSGVVTVTTPSAPVFRPVGITPGTQTHPAYDGLVATLNSNAVNEAQRSGGSTVPVIRAQSVEETVEVAEKSASKPPEGDASIVPPPTGPSPEEEHARLTRHETRVKAMLKQASLVMDSWTPSAHRQFTVLATQKVAEANRKIELSVEPGGASLPRISAQNTKPKVLAVAGVNIYYAMSRTAINSDLPGPVLVDVITGPLKGAVLIGAYTLPENASSTVLSFKIASNVSGVLGSVAIDAIAVDVATSGYGIATNVDHHSIERWGSLLGASFLKGAGRAVTNMGQKSNIISTPMQTVIQTDKPNTKQIVTAGLGEFGDQLSEEIKGGFHRPATVTVKARQEMGILFLSDVVIK